MANIFSVYTFELVADVIRFVGYKKICCLCPFSELIDVSKTVCGLELGDFFLFVGVDLILLALLFLLDDSFIAAWM